METDVCLRGSDRAIILDTKFYAQALKVGEHGTARLPPPNLYQLFTYLRQRSCELGWEKAEGVLLYAKQNGEWKHVSHRTVKGPVREDDDPATAGTK